MPPLGVVRETEGVIVHLLQVKNQKIVNKKTARI
jgi:hypothetical protein